MWQWEILQVGAIILLSCYVQQLFAVEEVNPYCFSMYHTETKKISLVYFYQYTKKWLEITFWTHDFVSSATRR